MSEEELQQKFIDDLNKENERIFRQGGVCIPTFKDYKAYQKFCLIFKAAFPSVPDGFKFDALNADPTKIVYRIDPKFLKEKS